MRVTGSTHVAAVIGSPVRHSLSPAMHNAAFDAKGSDWVLAAFEVASGHAAAAIAAMRTFGIRGLAVTMPHKEVVAGAVDEVDAAAAQLRSVNTVVLRDDGSTFGASTDGNGFVASLREAGCEPAGLRIAILGAGAAARSIVDALGRAGAGDVVVLNRTPDRARNAAALAPCGRVGSTSDIGDADIVVNTTPVGMDAAAGSVAAASAPLAAPGSRDDLPCDPELLSKDQVVADIVYHPLETPLLRAAAAAGATTVDGLGMLVHQAVLQQELWTGHRPDPRIMRAAAEAEIAQR